MRTFIIAAVVLAVSQMASATMLTLETTDRIEDAWIWAGGGGGPDDHMGLQMDNGQSGYLKHVFIRFNLSDIPAGAIINSAVYDVSDSGSGFGPQPTIGLYYATQPWVENEISWSEYAIDLGWTPGGDYEATPAIELNLPGADSWTSFSMDLTTMVRAWANGSETNNGLVMAYMDTVPTDWAGFGFIGSEAADTDGYMHVRPKLNIDYDVPEPGTITLLVLGGLALLRRRRA